MKGLTLSCILLISLFLFSSCDDENDGDECTYVTNISADQSCYAGNGLLLTAERDGPQVGIEWTVYAVKDSAANGWTENDRKIFSVSTNMLTIPDSIVKNYKTLIVSADVNCNGIIKYSNHYRFIPTYSATGICTVWTLNQPN